MVFTLVSAIFRAAIFRFVVRLVLIVLVFLIFHNFLLFRKRL